MTRRSYGGAAVPTTLSGAINATAVAFTVADASGYPTGAAGPFFVVVDAGTASEEKILVASRVDTAFNVAASGRGADGTVASSHLHSAPVAHVWTATDADEANAHVNASGGVHGAVGTVVGTSDTQTLTNKTISGAANNLSNIPSSAVTGLDGSLAGLDTRLDAVEADITALEAADTARYTKTEVDALLNALVPVGTTVGGVVGSRGTWLPCDGRLLARSSYPALFAAIGTTYGAGDGSTTFGIPDLRGRVPVGPGTGTGLTQRVAGATGGAEKLAVADLPAHTHTINHDHASATSSAAGTHTHAVSSEAGPELSGTGNTFYIVGSSGSSASAGSHTHTVNLPSFSGTSGSTGSGASDSRMQPYQVIPFYIRVL